MKYKTIKLTEEELETMQAIISYVAEYVEHISDAADVEIKNGVVESIESKLYTK